MSTFLRLATTISTTFAVKQDISTFTEVGIIQDSHPIRSACFSLNGNYFGIGTNSKALKLFSLKNLLTRIDKPNKFNLEQNFAASGDDLKLVFEEKEHHEGTIYCMDWSYTGGLIATGSNDTKIKLLIMPELDNDELYSDGSRELLISGHRGIVRNVCFNPNNELNLLSAGDVDREVKLWETETGSLNTNLIGHKDDIYALKWSNDGQILGSAGADRTIQFWDLRHNKVAKLINAMNYSAIKDISIFTGGQVVK